ncbi:hypothetical protein GEMMAAP_12790 [Gemmatimonas phototrophica]|uniref:Uncharacterized protein n=1 Tax=Gemmatimonas phototrophica TaxID=1379270 RepID=A0A143BLW7_9BACT|nr:hypothetical protein GEMMAAP_12790 [Gemmatimonas phototrophica]
MLVALPLALLAAVAATAILIRVARTARAQDSMLSNASALRHAVLVVATELAPLDGRDLVTVTDTLLEFHGHLGVLEVCGGSVAEVVVATPAGSPSGWVSTIRAGDQLRGWRTTHVPGDAPQAVARQVAAPPQVLPPASCGMGQHTVRRWRLQLADSLIEPGIGTPLLLTREVRFEHYRSGSTWWLGRRSRDGAGWDGLQPVVGPLSSPMGGGLMLRAHSANGAAVATPVPLQDSVARTIAGLDLTVRMPRRMGQYNGGRSDSASVSIALRASAPGRTLP